MAADGSPPQPAAAGLPRRARSPLLPPRPVTVRAQLPPPRRDRSRSPQRWRQPQPGGDYEDDMRGQRGGRGGRNAGRAGRGRAGQGGGGGGPPRMRSRSPLRFGRDRSHSPQQRMGAYRDRSRSPPLGRFREGGPPRPRDGWDGPSSSRNRSRDRAPDGSLWRRSISPPRRGPRSPSPLRRSPPPYRQQGPSSDRPSLLSRLAGGGPREFDYEDGEVSPVSDRGPRSRGGVHPHDRLDRRRGSPERPRALKDRIMLPDEGYDSGPAVLDYDEIPESTTPPLPPSPPAPPAAAPSIPPQTESIVREPSPPPRTMTPPFEPPPAPTAAEPVPAAEPVTQPPPARRSRWSTKLPTPPPPTRPAAVGSSSVQSAFQTDRFPASSGTIAHKDGEQAQTRGRSRTRSPVQTASHSDTMQTDQDRPDGRMSPTLSTPARSRSDEAGPSSVSALPNGARVRSPSADKDSRAPQRRRLRSPSPARDRSIHGDRRPPLPGRRRVSQSPARSPTRSTSSVRAGGSPPSRGMRRRSSSSRSRSRSRGASSPDKRDRSRRSTSSRRRSLSRSRSPSVPPPRADVDTSRYPHQSRSPLPAPRSPRRGGAAPLGSQSGAFGSFIPPPGPGPFRAGRGGFDPGFAGRGASRGRPGWGPNGVGRGGALGMAANGVHRGHHVPPPAGPSSHLPVAPAFAPVAAPLGPRTKDHRPWAERNAARAAEQAEAEVERERRAVREADRQEMVRRKEEEERKSQPLGGKEWQERLEARALERARIAHEAEHGGRSAEPTPDADVEMQQDPSPQPSPQVQSIPAPSPVEEPPISRESAIHPSRRSYVQTPTRPFKAEDDTASLNPSDIKPIATSVVHDRLMEASSPAASTSSRQPAEVSPLAAGPASASPLPNKSVLPAVDARPTPLGHMDRPPPVHGLSQSRERSPPPRPAARPAETPQEEKDRVQRERADVLVATLLQKAPMVDLYRHWGGQGKIQSDAALRQIQTASLALDRQHTRLYVELWRAEQDLKNGALELQAVEERKRIAEAGIKR